MTTKTATRHNNEKYLSIISGLFVSSLLVSNIIAQKLIPVGPFVFTAGILLFPVTYIFGDCLTEVYGYARTRQIIWTGFAGNILLSFFMQLSIWLPPANGWGLQSEFAQVFSSVPRIVAASVVAYWVGEFSNSYVMAKMKIWTQGRNLWMRTIGSTVVGQGFDTAVFVLIAFYGNTPNSVIITIIWSGYLFKVFYEALATPLTYWIVNTLKKHEGIDRFDRSTNFTPFSLKKD